MFKPHDAMKAALACGEKLAARSGALSGISGLTTGMHQLDTNFWNDKRTRMPGWAWILNMPKEPESPAFVEAMVLAAAMHRGIPADRVKVRAHTKQCCADPWYDLLLPNAQRSWEGSGEGLALPDPHCI